MSGTLLAPISSRPPDFIHGIAFFLTSSNDSAPAGMKDEKAVCVGTQTARLRLKTPGATQTVRTCEKLGYRLFVSVLRVE